MDETNQKPKEEDTDIGIPIAPLVLGGMLTTGPLTGAGLLPFVGGNLFKDKEEDSDTENDEEEDELRR